MLVSVKGEEKSAVRKDNIKVTQLQTLSSI